MGDFREELRSGWRSLTGCAIGIGFGIGCYPPVSSLFFRALETEFVWSKSAAVLSLISLPVAGLILPLVGALVDRLGVRRVVFVSVLCFSGSLFGLSFLDGHLFSFYLLFAAMNILGCGTTPVGYTRSIVAAFKRSRGFALSIALLGTGLSSVFLPSLFAPMVAAGHWRLAYRSFAAIALVTGVTACLLMQEHPERVAVESPKHGVDLPTALRSRSFWILALAVLFINTASVGLLSQYQSVIAEGGLSLLLAARLIPLLSISVIVSRVVVGRALDLFSAYKIAAGSISLAGLGACFLLFRGTHPLPMSVLATLLLGVSFGAEVDILTFICARRFGVWRYGSIYGALYLFFNLGIAVGGLAYGQAHDRFGSYQVAILMTVVLLFVAAALFLSLMIPDRGLLQALAKSEQQQLRPAP